MARLGNRWAACLALTAALSGPAWSQVVFPPGSSLDVAGGALIAPCSEVQMSGELILGPGTLNTGTLAFNNGATVSGTGGELQVSGDLTSAVPLNLGTSSVVLSDTCLAPGAPPIHLSGHIVVQNLTLISNAAPPTIFMLPPGTNITVLGTLTLGTPGKPVTLASSGPGTAVIAMGPAAVLNNAGSSIIPGNVQIGAAPAAPASIPTLGTYGLMLLSLLLGGFAMRRQRRAGSV